ncbi:SIMPL domain-containing protein [Thermopolyspora sp. NPDC052614]|uniref:SIMPL domain-containing protein n=1 Tax=Thermopolyspora sp. NPDC052614 TaxID=3155682 RepID=UPI003419FAFB
MTERAEPVVRVRGETTLEVEPEIARLTVVVRAQDKNRRRTLESLTERNQACLDLIGRYGDAVEDVDTSAVAVVPELREGRGERVRAYHGGVRIRVTVRDFGVLGELVTLLGDEELTTVEGPRWELRPGSGVYDQAAEQAVHAALAKAKTYARTLGTEITGVVEIADAGLSSTPTPGDYALAPTAMAFQRASAFDAGGPPAIALEPETIQVHAVVEATFRLAPPTSL